MYILRRCHGMVRIDVNAIAATAAAATAAAATAAAAAALLFTLH